MIFIYNNTKWFYQVADALCWALRENRVECQIVDKFEEKSMHIILGIQLVDELPEKYIVYNFEQLSVSKELSEGFYNKLENSVEIWDYSLNNVEFLKKKCLEARFLPFGWAPCLEVGSQEPTLDILFLGGLSERRLRSLSSLINYPKTFIGSGCFYQDWDKLVARTKIGLNIHYYEPPSILEVCRLVPLMANRCLVISERSDDRWYDEQFEGKAVLIGKDEVVETSLQWLEKEEELKQKVEKAYQWLVSEFNYAMLVKESGLLEFLITENIF